MDNDQLFIMNLLFNLLNNKSLPHSNNTYTYNIIYKNDNYIISINYKDKLYTFMEEYDDKMDIE
jgi:hypothetical protein